MSYCRWSSMGYRSDLYVYADVSGGVTIHVALYHREFPDDMPEEPYADLLMTDTKAWAKKNQEYMEGLDRCRLRPIGLSRDGESYNLPHHEAADLVASLREEGYIVPEGVEEDILEDIED